MKSIRLLTVVFLLGASFLPANLLAVDQFTNPGIKEYRLDQIQGKVVKSKSGEDQGIIRDVVVDSKGRGSVAIIAQGAPLWE